MGTGTIHADQLIQRFHCRHQKFSLSGIGGSGRPNSMATFFWTSMISSALRRSSSRRWLRRRNFSFSEANGLRFGSGPRFRETHRPRLHPVPCANWSAWKNRSPHGEGLSNAAAAGGSLHLGKNLLLIRRAETAPLCLRCHFRIRGIEPRKTSLLSVDHDSFLSRPALYSEPSEMSH